jgi:hypothetical protein
VGLPNEALEVTESAQGLVRNRFERPSPAYRKRPKTCFAESRQRMATRSTQRGKATGSCSSVEKDTGRYEEDAKPPLVTSGAIISSDPDQEVVQEEATPDDIPSSRRRTKFEPSSANRKRPRTCLAESGRTMADRTNKRDNATGSCSAMEKDDGCDEEDPELPLVPSSVRTRSDPDQEVVQEKATPDDLLSDRTRAKLERDWYPDVERIWREAFDR